MAYFRRSALPLKAAQGIRETANAMRLQPVGLSLEVTQPGPAHGRDHEDSIEIPGWRQLLFGSKHPLGLEPRPDAPLARL